ncbi:MAG TPA: hypothetical protein VH637_05545 [Streptosporangiaceae bacterium]
MTDQRQAAGRQPSLAVRAILAAAFRAGRSDARRVLLVAIGVSLLSAGAEAAVEAVVDQANVPAAALADVGTGAVSMLGVVFLSGFLSQLAGESGHGRPHAGLPQLLRNLPWLRLILVDLLVVLVVAAGLAALIIPGLIAFNLLAVSGPVVEIEGSRVLAAVRRSAHLVRQKFWTVGLLATLPVMLTEELPSLPHESADAGGILYVIGVQGVAGGIIEAALGLILAELCYRLIELDRARAGLVPAGGRAGR